MRPCGYIMRASAAGGTALTAVIDIDLQGMPQWATAKASSLFPMQARDIRNLVQSRQPAVGP